MGVYYKFKSAKDYDSVPVDGHFISVGLLKEQIFKLKHLGGTDYDLIVTNAHTNEEYLDAGMLIPKNTSVLIRRVPGLHRKPIVTAAPVQPSFAVADESSGSAGSGKQDFECDEFGDDIYAMPKTPVLSQPQVAISKEEEDSKIKTLIGASALDWQRPRLNGFEKKTVVPPRGYICHRCKVAGHFIQHCPMNGDPDFDIKRVKPPTGIPKSMLMATPDGSYVLQGGAAGVFKPNEAAFEKEIEGMPSTRPAVTTHLPREVHCPLCQQVMKDAVLASKCCFKSFCDKCIRDHLMSKSMCECGATSVLADHLLPNKTLRDTIIRMNGTQTATTAATSSNEQKLVEVNKQPADNNVPLESEKGIALNKVPAAATNDHSTTVKSPLGDEEQGRKKKICMPPMQWWTGPEKYNYNYNYNYMMPMGPWNGMYAAPPMPYGGGYGVNHIFRGFAGPQRDLSELVGFKHDLKRKREMEIPAAAEKKLNASSFPAEESVTRKRKVSSHRASSNDERHFKRRYICGRQGAPPPLTRVQ